MNAPTESAAPLQGLRVLDMTIFLSGPYCTQILADLGAEVTKLESPQGDLSRGVPPHFVGDDSVYYLSINRNKSSIVVDLKTPEGLAIARRLALASDVVIENNRPGVLDRLGLRADELRRENPRLIWCALSGFGQTGPYRDKPAYDMIVQALSGGMSMTGEPDGRPVRAGIPIGDIAAGMYSAVGILAALNRRHTTGRGDFIDIGMLDCQVAMLSYQGAYHLHSGKVPPRQGSGHDSIPTYRGFTGADGKDFVICANTERNWQALCKVLGREQLIDDPRFRTNRDRYENRFALWELLEHGFKAQPAEHWVTRLEQESVPVAIVNPLDRVATDPHVRERDMILEIMAPDGRTARVMGNPIKFVEAAPVSHRFPPRLGEHTQDVLDELMRERG
jgi:crotonobetainyl-CoA:carnitine CoA-transferase CaiB-like acyl-CoA transferase